MAKVAPAVAFHLGPGPVCTHPSDSECDPTEPPTQMPGASAEPAGHVWDIPLERVTVQYRALASGAGRQADGPGFQSRLSHVSCGQIQLLLLAEFPHL